LKYKEKSWKKISLEMERGRTKVQCLNRWNKITHPALKKGQWSEEEDELLRQWVKTNGTSFSVIHFLSGPFKWVQA